MIRWQPLCLLALLSLNITLAVVHAQNVSNPSDLGLTLTSNSSTSDSNVTLPSANSSLPLNGTNTSIAPAVVSKTAACENASFAAAYAVKLGKSPIIIKNFIQGDQVCIQYDLQEPTAGWFGVGFARQPSMVSDPPVSMLVYQRGQDKPLLYLIQGFNQTGTPLLEDQSAIAVFAATTQETGLTVTFQRSIIATAPTEAPIELSGPATLVWAYGDTWPTNGLEPAKYGIASYNFISWKSTKHSFCDTNNCPLIFGSSGLGLMVLGGLMVLASRKFVISHWLLHRSLTKPPTKLVSNERIEWNPLTLFWQMLSDFYFGEILICLIFIGVLWVFVKASSNDWETTVSGRLSVIAMMFLFLPISRVPWLWQTVFGSSFERIVKFHRWLGIIFLVMLIVHIKYCLKYVGLWDAGKAANAYPLWGTLATICFVVMGVLSIGPLRRAYFELFYYAHRILSIVGVVFSIMHAAYIGKVMIFSLSLYGISLLWRWLQCFKYFGMKAQLHVHQTTSDPRDGETTVSVVLKPTMKTKLLANTMDPCSYFWVNISSLSMIEWHPFSAIVTPQQDSIGFVVKSMGKGSFSEKLTQLAKENPETRVTLCGPFGRIGLNLDDYEVVILVAGGVGITPLLSLLNQYTHSADEEAMTLKRKPLQLKEFHVIWSVRDVENLLMVDEFVGMGINGGNNRSSRDSMVHHPQDSHLGPRVHWMRHVSGAKSTTINSEREECSVRRPNGEEIFYSLGRPILDEVINTSRFGNKKQHIAVLACGPPTLVAEAQELARACHFDFHKEVFDW